MQGYANMYNISDTQFINADYHYVFLEDWGTNSGCTKIWFQGEIAKGSDILEHFNNMAGKGALNYSASAAIEKETGRMGLMVKRLRKHKEDTMQIYFDEHAASSGAMGLALKAILLLPYEYLPQLIGDKTAEQEPWSTIIKLRLEQVL